MAHRFSRVHRLFAVVVAAVLLVGLAGCRSNPDPAPLPPAPSSSAAKPTPSTAAPTMPSEANGTGAKAAKAFVRYWISLMNHAMQTGNTQPSRAASTRACSSCAAMFAKIDRVYAAGGKFRGDGWSVRQVRYQPYQPRLKPALSVSIIVAPQTMTKRAGARPRTFPGGPNQLIFKLAWDTGGWHVTDFGRLS